MADYDDSDYYQRHRDAYDPEEAPYEPLAPDLAGQSPLSSWRSTEARPTRSGGQVESDSGMQLREASVIGASPTPEQEQVREGAEGYSTPAYWGKENIQEVNTIMGGQPATTTPTESYYGKTLRVMQQYAQGVGGYIAQKAADVFSRSRGGS